MEVFMRMAEGKETSIQMEEGREDSLQMDDEEREVFLQMKEVCDISIPFSPGKDFSAAETSATGLNFSQDNSTSLQCDICGELESSAARLIIHKQSHGKLPIECVSCRHKFKTVEGCRIHVKTFHKKKFSSMSYTVCSPVQTAYSIQPNRVQGRIPCRFCSSAFSKLDRVFIHMNSAHGPFKIWCKLCHKALKSQQSLKLHALKNHQIKLHYFESCQIVLLDSNGDSSGNEKISTPLSKEDRDTAFSKEDGDNSLSELDGSSPSSVTTGSTALSKKDGSTPLSKKDGSTPLSNKDRSTLSNKNISKPVSKKDNPTPSSTKDVSTPLNTKKFSTPLHKKDGSDHVIKNKESTPLSKKYQFMSSSKKKTGQINTIGTRSLVNLNIKDN